MKNPELELYKNRIKILNKIGVSISKEKNIPKLLSIILEESLNLTNSDAGSIYFRDKLEGKDALLFKCSINRTKDFDYVGKTILIDNKSVSGHVALTGETVVLNDFNDIGDVKFDKSFDLETDYKTKNMIVIPMKNEKNKVVGVFQILNKQDHNGTIVNYDLEDEEMIESLASQCAILIERIMLNDLLKRNVNITRTTLISFFNSMKKAVSVIGNDIIIEQQEFKEMATLDNLTGLMTRHEGISFLEKQLEFSQLNSIKLVLAFIDINNLKYVNDTFGHAEGDILIKTVVDLIQEAAREGDFMFRFGGDEFILCVLNANLFAANKMKERVYRKFDMYNETSDKEYTVSASFGFAEYNHIENQPIDELISIADKAMYIEKDRIKANQKRLE